VTVSGPALFLDRDGVIIDDVPYLSDPKGVRLKSGIADLIAFARTKAFRVFVVTNQSGVGRGKIKLEQLDAIHEKMKSMLLTANEHAQIDAIYFCPHHPEADLEEYRQVCPCRKPGDGMLSMACEEFEVDLAGSYMVGDRDSDMAAGVAKGVKALQICEPGGEFEVSTKADKVFTSVLDLLEYLKKAF